MIVARDSSPGKPDVITTRVATCARYYTIVVEGAATGVVGRSGKTRRAREWRHGDLQAVAPEEVRQ